MPWYIDPHCVPLFILCVLILSLPVEQHAICVSGNALCASCLSHTLANVSQLFVDGVGWLQTNRGPGLPFTINLILRFKEQIHQFFAQTQWKTSSVVFLYLQKVNEKKRNWDVWTNNKTGANRLSSIHYNSNFTKLLINCLDENFKSLNSTNLFQTSEYSFWVTHETGWIRWLHINTVVCRQPDVYLFPKMLCCFIDAHNQIETIIIQSI